jgi:tRNA A37 N6-isopentenylltransferase MiaA
VCFIIGGPTASGKSKLALWLAHHVDGEIINADSLQLYKSIPILTASPDNAELAQTRHHLFGIYHDDQISTVQDWTQLAQSTIDNVIKRQKTPIIVGGTGMYLNALIQGLSPMPNISDEIKKSVRTLQRKIFLKKSLSTTQLSKIIFTKMIASDWGGLWRSCYKQDNQSNHSKENHNHLLSKLKNLL